MGITVQNLIERMKYFKACLDIQNKFILFFLMVLFFQFTNKKVESQMTCPTTHSTQVLESGNKLYSCALKFTSSSFLHIMETSK